MIHLNTLGIRHSAKIHNYLALKLLYPNVYMCMSVQDFLDSKEYIKPSSRLNLYLPKGSIIVFQNSDLKLIERGFEISDLTGLIDIGECPPKADRSAQRKNLSNGKFRLLSVAYYPNTGYSYLLKAYQPGPPASESSPEEEKILKVSFAAS